jgi:FtsP/CotA-like multicopper oxidase with cupredoxin domain
MMKPIQKFSKIAARLFLVVMLFAGAVSLKGASEQAAAQAPGMPPVGMVCTSNSTSTFTLTTRTGYISVPDGNVVFMWGFSEGSRPFQHPSPVLCVNQGDTVTVVLNNTLNEDTSLIFPGQEGVTANGMLSQPVFDVDGKMVSLAPMALKSGGSMTYSFTAGKPGTYLYQSGTDSIKQVDMGLFGVLVVRPNGYLSTDPYGEPVAFAYDDPSTAYYPPHEYLLLISEMDPMLHVAVEQGYLFNMNNYTPRYWMYNGRSFPDTIADNGAGWLPSQPYGSLLFFYPYDDRPTVDGAPNLDYNPYPALLRIVNAGMMDYTHHPHGSHGRVLAWDGNLLESGGLDLSFEKFAVTISPGQTMDVVYDWRDVDKWNPIDNPIPVVIPQLLELTVGTFYSGSPYLGYLADLPPGTQALNQCGEFYHIAHNHALHQITAWGVVLSGHITFARIDPPISQGSCP